MLNRLNSNPPLAVDLNIDRFQVAAGLVAPAHDRDPVAGKDVRVLLGFVGNLDWPDQEKEGRWHIDQNAIVRNQLSAFIKTISLRISTQIDQK